MIRLSAGELGIEAFLVGRLRPRPAARPGEQGHRRGGRGRRRRAPCWSGWRRKLGWARPAVFERFATAQIRGGDFIVEVVQARAERYDPESRKPDVRPGSLEDDIAPPRLHRQRAGPDASTAGCSTSPGGGWTTSASGILRTPLDPADTFSEDPLRMFRAARFVAQLGFRLAERARGGDARHGPPRLHPLRRAGARRAEPAAGRRPPAGGDGGAAEHRAPRGCDPRAAPDGGRGAGGLASRTTSGSTACAPWSSPPATW